MNPEQLWETTMSPENRNLLQIKIEDAQSASDTFNLLWVMKLNQEENIFKITQKMLKIWIFNDKII